MVRIYTRGGDKGQTGLRGGSRVPKDDPRIEAAGDIDELNACLGLARASLKDHPEVDDIIQGVQHELFILGAEIASPLAGKTWRPENLIEERHIKRLEDQIDSFYKPFKALNTFVLPAGGLAGAALHLARTTARRAERAITRLSAAHEVRPEVKAYINRLSDLLFAMALSMNRAEGVEEIHPDYSR